MRARRTYSKETQQKVLGTYDKQKRKSCKALSLKFKIPRSTVNRWVWDNRPYSKHGEGDIPSKPWVIQTMLDDVKDIHQRANSMFQMNEHNCAVRKDMEDNFNSRIAKLESDNADLEVNLNIRQGEINDIAYRVGQLESRNAENNGSIEAVRSTICKHREHIDKICDEIYSEFFLELPIRLSNLETTVGVMQKSNRVFMFVVAAFSVVEFALIVWLR